MFPELGGIWDPSSKIDKVAEGALAYQFPDEDEPLLADGNITARAIEVIRALPTTMEASNTSNFFLAVGLHKPHIVSVPPRGIACSRVPGFHWLL